MHGDAYTSGRGDVSEKATKLRSSSTKPSILNHTNLIQIDGNSTAEVSRKHVKLKGGKRTSVHSSQSSIDRGVLIPHTSQQHSLRNNLSSQNFKDGIAVWTVENLESMN